MRPTPPPYSVTAACRALAQRSFDLDHTLQALRLHGVAILLSWGIHRKFIESNTKYKNEADYYVFMVQGHHFKGWVCITLQWNDLYQVNYLTARGRQALAPDVDVYFDDLTDVIDNKVERIADYKI